MPPSSEKKYIGINQTQAIQDFEKGREKLATVP